MLTSFIVNASESAKFTLQEAAERVDWSLFLFRSGPRANARVEKWDDFFDRRFENAKYDFNVCASIVRNDNLAKSSDSNAAEEK